MWPLLVFIALLSLVFIAERRCNSGNYNASFRFHRYTGSPISSSICSMVWVREMGFQFTRPGQTITAPIPRLTAHNLCKIVKGKHAAPSLHITMLCYVMTRILGTDGDAEGKQSPGVYCTSLGRLGGIKPARRTDCCLEQARNGGTARDRNAERA